MEGTKVFEEAAPQESSPAPGTSSPREDQSAAAHSTIKDTKGELDQSPPTSPDAGVEKGRASDNSPIKAQYNYTPSTPKKKAPMEDNKLLAHRKSFSLSSLEAKTDNPSPPSITRASDDLDTLKPLKEEEMGDDSISTPHANNGHIMSQEFSERTKGDYVDLKRRQIDTTAPFQSVKAAVSKFGGIVDWKAHRLQTVERQKIIEQELQKAQEEMLLYRKQYKAAEAARKVVVKELESTKRLVEELKLNLERAQMEEHQAKQDSELAKLRVEELEQGIADEASFAAKAQLEVARARHIAALSELKSVQDELEQLRKEYDLLVVEKDELVKKAEEAVFKSKEIDKSVEDLTIELITAKESLEAAHVAHLEAEEHRIEVVMAKEQETLIWEKELKQAEEELEKTKEEMMLSKDLKAKLDAAAALLLDLKAELATYMEGDSEATSESRADVEAALSSATKELERVKANLEKAINEANMLKVAATSLNSELNKEKAQLAIIQQREGMTSTAAASVEAELNRMKLDVALVQIKDKVERERMVELPRKLQEAAIGADRAKGRAQKAQQVLMKAEEEVEQAKAGASAMESRVRATRKEIEAAKATEKLAFDAINALSNNGEDSPNKVTLSLEEYYELSKRAHNAEEQANMLVADALSQIEIAKESELKSLNKLEAAKLEMADRKRALEIVLEKAKEGKLGIEQEFRKWRAEHEQRRKASESITTSVMIQESKNNVSAPNSSDTEINKKKRSFFPKIFMFLGRKKEIIGV